MQCRVSSCTEWPVDVDDFEGIHDEDLDDRRTGDRPTISSIDELETMGKKQILGSGSSLRPAAGLQISFVRSLAGRSHGLGSNRC
jgi:hypothetical protein